uniref:Uncharacterized protein LOC105074083 isoform X1 n=1 Tax=Camelus bactrianus TaxID=9837 RepID=A0A9W3GES9_CAMBA|nr:uncharacterized protein LOC105074083 isoform X1 [Camelus bactrianus]
MDQSSLCFSKTLMRIWGSRALLLQLSGALALTETWAVTPRIRGWSRGRGGCSRRGRRIGIGRHGEARRTHTFFREPEHPARLLQPQRGRPSVQEELYLKGFTYINARQEPQPDLALI